MITKDNLKTVLQTINPEDIENALNGAHDWVKLELHIFNVGGFGTIENLPYNGKDEEETQNNGNLFIHVDTFADLLEETQALEY